MSSPQPPQKQVSSVDEKENADQQETHVPRAGCGILGRYPVISVLIFAVVGVGIGVGLSAWDPSDPTDKEVAVKWIGLIGDMFIRVLKAVVLPLVFVNVILSIVEMMAVGRASTVGGKTIGMYLLTTLIASIIGIISILIFKTFFETADDEIESEARFQFGCNATGGHFLARESNGNVFCTGNLTEDDPSHAVGTQTDLADSFSNVGFLCISVMAGMFVHVFFVYTGIFYFITRDNPFGFLKFVLPAQTTAFACASSAATMPVSLECAEASGRVPKPIARFVIPLGATINMDGSAIYFPCACVWLAVLNGLSPTFANYIMLAILSTIGSAGTAPVPSAGLVMVLTAYNSVFNTTGVPDGFEFVVAIDWFLDRLQTVVNVTGDNVVAASISHMVSLEESDTSSNEDDAVGASSKDDEEIGA
eukprot:scaffold1931_cov77-Cylindrotheca_fusiformis.AAC.1